MAALCTAIVPALARADDQAGCPVEPRGPILRDAPEQLLGCAKSPRPVEWVWAAHAEMALGRPARASGLYRKALGAPAVEPLSPVLALAAARAAGYAGNHGEGLKILTPMKPGPRWLRGEVAAARADLAFAAGDAPFAIESARRALADRHPGPDSLLAVIARAAVASGDRRAFEETVRTIRVDYPHSDAAVSVERLAREHGVRPAVAALGADLLAQRWRRWASRGGAQDVADECAPVSAALAGATVEVARARLECGKALSTLRRRDAEPMLRAAAGERTVAAEALLGVARVRSRSDDAVPVEATCAELEKAGARGELAECSFLAAFMRLNRGDRAGARASFERLIARHARTARAADAAWLLAFDTYQTDRPAAPPLFQAIIDGTKDPVRRAQATYWFGRAIEPSDAARAAAAYEQARALDGLGYYGWLATVRLGREPPRGTGDACRRVPSPDTATTPPAPARLAALLLEAGFRRYAAQELSEVLAPRRRDALAWSDFLAQAGQYSLLLDVGLAQGGHGESWPIRPERREAAEAAFPYAFPDALATAPDGVDRCLLLALMRRESRFDPDAASAAEARGLLQLLPRTAENLARELRIPTPPPEHLHDPATNVRLAGAYVARLEARFAQPLLAAAAYNAGPEAVARWLRQFRGLELDEFVERIPYRETREYVKAVGGALSAYSLLYTGRRAALSFAPVQPAPPGIDY